MIVVIVVSRRVGQVTLAVSERTSCRNLNGLMAIVDMIRSVNAIFGGLSNPNSPLAPSPRSKDEPPSGLDCSGEFKAAPDIRQTGRQQVAAMYCASRQRSRWAGTKGCGPLWEAATGTIKFNGLGWRRLWAAKIWTGRSGRA